MHDIIEKPVRWHARADNPCCARRAPHGVINHANQDAPGDLHDQAVRVWVGDEIERRGASDSGRDAHLFDTQQQKKRPEKIRKVCGEDQRAEGSLRRQLFRGHRHGEVPNKHFFS